MADNDNTNTTAELERLLARNVQGTPEFARQADRRALEEAQSQAEQGRLLSQTISGPPKQK